MKIVHSFKNTGG